MASGHAALGDGTGPSAAREGFRLRWLLDLGAESLVASPQDAGTGPGPIVVAVPGAAYVFTVGPDGSLRKSRRLAADPSAPYGVAATDGGVIVASKDGLVSSWKLSPSGEPSLRWQRHLGERATSVGWDGGERVLVATWANELVALSSADGRTLWTADVGGRAEAPAVVDGRDVLVATKAKALLRVDAATGAVRWRAALPGLVVHPPALLGEAPRLAVCGTWDGQLVAHDVRTGRVRWSAALPAKLAGPPLAGPGFVAAVTADGSTHAYAPAGELRWSQTGSAAGAAGLLAQSGAGVAPRLVVVSRMLVTLDLGTGARITDYPKGAVEELRRRFADAMLEGVKTYSEGEKRVLLEREAFEIPGELFGPARLTGSQVAFGTEDGWAYLFDAPTLRPLARYRAGQPASGLPLLAAGRVLATGGEEVFGLDPETGRVLWRRGLGAEVGPMVGEATVGAVAGGRLHALDPIDGVPRWSLRGGFRSVAPPGVPASAEAPWLAADGEGRLHALWPSGRAAGEALPAGGDLLRILPSSERSWVVAIRAGSVFAVSWEEPSPGPDVTAAGGRLLKGWETRFEERLVDVRLAEGRIVVRTESGSLVGFDPMHEEVWRLRLAGEESFDVVPSGAAVLVWGPAELRIHDWVSGETTFRWKAPSAAVGADLRGRSLVWLDRSGGAHRVDVPEGRLVETADLGVPLAAAAAAQDGFLVVTAAGEVGFVDVAGDSASGQAAVEGGGEAQ